MWRYPIFLERSSPSSQSNSTSPERDRLITNYDPEYIQSFCTEARRIHTLPWLEGSRVRIDFSAPDKDVLRRGRSSYRSRRKILGCPRSSASPASVRGLVYYPTPGGMAKGAVLTSKEDLGRMLWKAKGEKHGSRQEAPGVRRPGDSGQRPSVR